MMLILERGTSVKIQLLRKELLWHVAGKRYVLKRA